MENILFRSFPCFHSFVDKENLFANFHYRIHIVGVDNSSNIKLHRDFMNQLIDDQGSFRIES